jgi:beta-aspartyl-peptidase (threonine type)
MSHTRTLLAVEVHMQSIRLALSVLFAAMAVSVLAATPTSTALVIHGGAGTMQRSDITPALERDIRAALDAALDAGDAVLKDGGAALDAVAAAVAVLEDSPHFNAGKGAVFTAEGRNELDAAIMDGATLRAGAVAGVRRIRNPIHLARAVMDRSKHVMLTGDGAEAFARSVGIDLVKPRYFHTERRWQQLQDARARESAGAQLLPASANFGTVGAVARDVHGHLAAATSTGGMTNKRWGRVGDAPIIGAGTYANARCGVSATGWGEFFIRLSVAHDICARMEYRGDSIGTASNDVVMMRVPDLGGDGGVIAMDADGNIAMPFNTGGMYRAWINTDGTRGTAIFRDPE